MRTTIACATIAVALISTPAAAHAACGPAASINATAAARTVPAGAEQPYTYALCFGSAPDRYDTQVFAVTVNADGEITGQRPVSPLTATSLAGAGSPVTGQGAYRTEQPGEYMLRVRYYAAGRALPETTGQALWQVTAPTDPAPVPPVTGPAPPRPQGDPHGGPLVRAQGEPTRTAITVRARALPRAARPGARVRVRLTVHNSGAAAAVSVGICGRLPARTQFISAGRPVRFHGARACMLMGALAPGQSRTVHVTLRVDRTAPRGRARINATATAANAGPAVAHASLRVRRASARRVHAPVTG